jgi:hypothetical protein
MAEYYCDCSVDVDSEAALDPCFMVQRRARKAYVCCECGELISRGQEYEHTKGLVDGRWDTYRTCLPCVRMRESFCPGGWPFGYLGETIKECLGWSPYETQEHWNDKESE